MLLRAGIAAKLLYPSLRRKCQVFVGRGVHPGTLWPAGSTHAPVTMQADQLRTGRMVLDIVVVMDPIGSIRIAKDSTFAMLLEAQRRGHRLHYVRPGGSVRISTTSPAPWS